MKAIENAAKLMDFFPPPPLICKENKVSNNTTDLLQVVELPLHLFPS